MKKFKVLKKEDLARAKLGELFVSKESFFLEGYPGCFTLVHLASESSVTSGGAANYRLEAYLGNCADGWPDLVIVFEPDWFHPAITEVMKKMKPSRSDEAAEKACKDTDLARAHLRQIHRLRDYLLRQGVLSADSSEDIVNAAISMLDNDEKLLAEKGETEARLMDDLRRIKNDRDDLLQKLSKAQDKIKGNQTRMVAEIKVNLDEGRTAREAAEIALRDLGEHPAQKDLDRLQEYMNGLGWDTPPQNPVTAAIEGIELLRKRNKELERDNTITAIMKELDGKNEVELTLQLDNEAVARCIMDLVRKTNKGFFKRIRGIL